MIGWNVNLVKFDNCGEYGLGNARFVNFADAINATGVPIVLLTEPFSLQPTPSHREFAHAWRTTNDINPSFTTILDRADTNDKWAALAGPGECFAVHGNPVISRTPYISHPLHPNTHAHIPSLTLSPPHS